jgi:hypothetical protein
MAETMEVKNDYSHHPKDEHKHHSRNDYKLRHKNKHVRRSRKNDDYKKKTTKAMVVESDVDSSSYYTSTSLSSEQENQSRHKVKKHTNKNINGLIYFMQEEGLYGVAQISRTRGSGKNYKDSKSDNEVNCDFAFLLKENVDLNALLDNHDGMHRKAKKTRLELRALLDEPREKVVELESSLVDARVLIESLKTTLVVSDEADCTDSNDFLVDLIVLNERYASRVEELDMVKVEIDELKSRPALLAVCTSYPLLHGKLDEAHSQVVSLEAALKSLIANA